MASNTHYLIFPASTEILAQEDAWENQTPTQIQVLTDQNKDPMISSGKWWWWCCHDIPLDCSYEPVE
jgi:hypothetical protein